MGPNRVRSLLIAALALLAARCGSDGISPDTMRQIRQAHDRFLTVDGRVDVAAGSSITTRGRAGELDAIFLVISMGQARPAPLAAGGARAAAIEAIRSVRAMVKGLGRGMSVATSPEDAYRLEKEGRQAVYIGLGAGVEIGEDPAAIQEYHREGVRSLTLASALAPAGRQDGGLGDLGRRVVEECNRAGLILDLADCSEKMFWDVLASSRAPVIVTHGAARAICDRPGNLSDGMIRAVAEKGGVVLVSFDPARLVPGGRAARAAVADHIRYLVGIAGAAGVGIGSCFGGGGGVSGCRDAGDMLNLTVEMLRRGIGEYDFEAIWGGNIMRVFREVEEAASRK